MALASYCSFNKHFEEVCGEGGDYAFYLCTWSATVPCLILEGEGFSLNFANQSKSKAKENDIVEL